MSMEELGRPCGALRADGQPCRGTARPARPFCFAHDASTKEQRQAGNREGGTNSAHAVRAQQLVPTPLRPVLALLVRAMQEVHGGVITPAQASAMSACASSIARLYDAVEVEQRLDALERANEQMG